MPNNPKHTQVAARLPKDQADYLRRLAAQEERSLSWVVSRVLRDFIEEEMRKK